jgi:hypothetical protein
MEPDGKRLTPLLEILPVFADVLPPLGRYRELVKDGVHRAHRLTIGAIDAGFGVDVVHIVAIGGDDAIHRANFDTTRVFNPDAGFGDYIRHTGNIATRNSRISRV